MRKSGVELIVVWSCIGFLCISFWTAVVTVFLIIIGVI